MAALLVAVGAVFFVATVALAAARLVRSARVWGEHDAELIPALKRVPAEGRLEELARRASPGSWEHRLAEEALGAESAEARVATLNDVLGELDHALQEGEAWPRAAVRLSVAWGLLLACLGVVLGRMELAIGLVVVGAASALAAAELGRRGQDRVQRQRAAIDQLVTTLLGTPRGAPEGASSGRTRRRSRPRA